MRLLTRKAKLRQCIPIIFWLLLWEHPTNAQTVAPITANDVSILFPLPKGGDWSNFISIADLTDSDGNRLFSDAAFAQFIAVAESADSKIIDQAGSAAQIGFPSPTKDMRVWLIAGIRLDLGAPGLSSGVQDKFGQIPQVRLILQPVTTEVNGNLKIHDRAAHLIFSFAKGMSPQQESCPVTVVPKIEPDLATFHPILDDFVALRDDLKAGKLGATIETGGPMNVHPALNSLLRKEMRDRLEKILETHLKATQVTALAVMGLPSNAAEPWIFLPMRRNPVTDTVSAVPSPALDGQGKAQFLRFFGSERVLPVPKSDNQNSIMTTCFRMPDARVGVSTVEAMPVTATPEQTADVTRVIADPTRSHFFNTDCISCHTETRLFLKKVPGAAVPGVEVSVLPETNWNVRNFGWGSEFGHMKPTITRRTATETEEVVKAINLMLANSQN
ncbi:hypothetical protein ACU8NU_26250 (plasmid) [Rhizobium leguminosarum]